MSTDKIEGIIEQEMPGRRKVTPKDETYNKYGDASWEIAIGSIEKHGTFGRSNFMEFRAGLR